MSATMNLMTERILTRRFGEIQLMTWMLIFLLLPLERYIVIDPASGATWNLAHFLLGAALLCLYINHWKLGELRLAHLKPPAFISLFIIFSLLAGLPTATSLQAAVMLLLCAWAGPSLYCLVQYRRTLAVCLLCFSLTIHSLGAIAQFSLQSDLNLHLLGETFIEVGRPGIATFTTLSGAKLARAYGPYPHPNVLAGSLVLGLIALTHYYQTNRPRVSASFTVIGYFLSLALLVSFSRVAWIGAALLYSVARLTKTEVVRALIVLITIIVCAPLLLARVPGSQEVALVERRDGVADARAILQQLPLWRGAGPGNYEHVLSEHFRQRHIAHEAWQIAPVHNVPLLLMVELGFLPVLILGVSALYFYARFFRHTWPLLVPLIPLLLFDHYLLTQAAPLVYLVTVGLLLADRPADSSSPASWRKHASVD